MGSNRTTYICFAKEDRALAEELKAFLAKHQIFSFMAEDSHKLNLYRIEAAACVVIICTDNTNGNMDIVKDILEAHHISKQIIPCFFSETPVSLPLANLINTEMHKYVGCLFKEEIWGRTADEIKKVIINLNK